nr:NAD(P)-dependent oxidoreductase [Dyella mobilis]
MADWSPPEHRAKITVFNDHLADPRQLIERLEPFDVLCVMRERTPLTREVIEQLPRLKLIASTGPGNDSIDGDAAAGRGIEILQTGYSSTPTIELAWALILAIARNVAVENQSLRKGGWQRSLGTQLSGKTLGLLGLGHIGSAVGVIGRAFRCTPSHGARTLPSSERSRRASRWSTKIRCFQPPISFLSTCG